MSWEVAADDVLSGKGAKTTGQNMFDRDVLLSQFGGFVRFTGRSDVPVGTTSWQTVATFWLSFQGAEDGDDVVVACLARVSGGTSPTYSVRLYDISSTTAGTQVDLTTSGTTILKPKFTLDTNWTTGIVRQRQFRLEAACDETAPNCYCSTSFAYSGTATEHMVNNYWVERQ